MAISSVTTINSIEECKQPPISSTLLLRLHGHRASDIKLGDTLRICIPSLAWTAWHPFTVLSSSQGEIELLIRAGGRWTSRLHDLDVGQRVWIDHPLPAISTARRFSVYSTVLAVAGGVGITGVLGLVSELSRAQQHSCTLVWIDRDMSSQLKWAKPMLEDLRSHGCEVQLFDSSASKESAFNDLACYPGRPDLDAALKSMSQQQNSVAIVCGPPSLSAFVTCSCQSAGIPIVIESFEL